jgi:FkbH-like protein
MLSALNRELAAAAGPDVLLVDCDRIAAGVGKQRWFDDRYWHLAKQAVALDVLPELARHTAAVIAAGEGLSTKCIAVDLDNTLWGGVVGEVGLAGLQLGGGPQGEAFAAFQEHLLALRDRGILLAVVSKNNDADAREVFERHPDMRLKLSDFAAFRAGWDDKATVLRGIASELGIGLDAIAFVDDNPAERAVVRRLAPEVEVVTLPTDPSGFVRALCDTLLFESTSLTQEDLARAAQYQARAGAAALAEQGGTLEDFFAGLAMAAHSAPFDEQNLPRIAQLVAKTNQFNLTVRRHGLTDLRAFAADPSYETMYLRLRDRFGDHGLVGVLVARIDRDVADIDTWLLSCRVIGRTVENEMLARLCRNLADRGITRLRGTFVPSEKNQLVAQLYGRLGFSLLADDEGTTTWHYDTAAEGVVTSEFIRPWDHRSDDA